jgi:hypothetical protein
VDAATKPRVSGPRGLSGAGRGLSGARRTLSGDKAARIVDAMRTSVAARGIAGSTFDHVATDAGVSRGLRGVVLRRVSEPELDIAALVEQAIVAARAVLS